MDILDTTKTVNPTNNLMEKMLQIGYEKEELEAKFIEIYNSDILKTQTFTSDDDKKKYAMNVLYAQMANRPPMKDYMVIPIGYSSIRTNKDDKVKATVDIFVLGKKDGSDDIIIRRVGLKGTVDDVSKTVKNLTLFAKYDKVKLGEFKSGNDMSADERSVFKDPIKIDGDIFTYIPIEKSDVVPSLKDTNLQQFQSKLHGMYTDNTDWKCIRGIILHKVHKSKDDGTEWGLYTIIDDSVDISKSVDSEGNIVQPGFTVWMNPSLMNCNEGDECNFFGTVTLDKNKKPSMNGYVIQPIHQFKL